MQRRLPVVLMKPVLPEMTPDSNDIRLKSAKTRLLVSVRNVPEAATAMKAGASLIDCKEPANGPLGRCRRETWLEIEKRIAGRRPLNAALGEWHEWQGMSDEQIRHELAALAGFQFAKLGPARSAENPEAFFEIFRTIMRLAPPGLKWIVVVYADEQNAASLGRKRLLQFALDEKSDGMLIDTYDKSRPYFYGKRLTAFSRLVKNKGLKLALAGGLTPKKIQQLGPIAPDWFAVRGAACQAGQRAETISFHRTRALSRLLNRI